MTLAAISVRQAGTFFKHLKYYKSKYSKKVSIVFKKRKPIASSLKFNYNCFYGE